MNCIFQVIRRQDGVRSPVAESDRATFATTLRRMMEEHPEQLHEDDYVLCVFEHLDSEGAKFSEAPVMTVGNFLQFEGTINV